MLPGSRSLFCILIREELEGILDGFEGAGIPDTHGLLLLFGGDDGILGPGGLMGVVDPGIDAPAVLYLCNAIGNIAPVVLSLVGCFLLLFSGRTCVELVELVLFTN